MMVLMVTRTGLQAGAVEEEPVNGKKTPYQVRYWTTEDGLPQHEIFCLKQTYDGYLWIGTHFGLSRFDGVHFTIFNEATTPEITNESIDALAEDSERTLWIGTPAGLLSYRNNQFQRVHITGEENQSVRRLTSSRDGGLWLSTSNSCVVRYQNGQFTHAWAASQKDDDVVSIKEGTDGWLNVFTKSKWLNISPNGRDVRTNLVRQPGYLQWSAALPGDTPQSAWIGTKQGLFQVSGESWKPIAEDWLGTNSVDLIFQDKGGNLWVGSRDEVFGRWDRSGWEPIDFEKITERSSAICMEEDAEGAIWIATTGGLVQLHEPLAIAYTEKENIAHNKVWSVCEGYDRAIWVGTERGLSRIDPSGKAEIIRAPGFPPDMSDRCVWPNRKGGVWTARNMAGLFLCQDGQFLPAAPASVLLSNSITCLGEGKTGLLYVCTEGAVFGFYQEAPIPWTQAAVRIDVPGVRSMLETDDGTIWLGTDGKGVARVRNNLVSYLTSADGLAGNHVWAIFRTKDGTLWFGTDKGLARYQNGGFFTFTRRQGLLEERINCILEEEGCFWLSGLSGIYRVVIGDLNVVAEGGERLVQPYALGTADGLKSAETNGEKQPAGWKARDGRLWFPTLRGVVAIDPRKIPTYEAAPPVIIEQLKADTNVVALSDASNRHQTKSANSFVADLSGASSEYPITAGHGHVLEFQYTATSLIDSKRQRFRYRLDGADTDWQETTERSVRYINLRPGNYRFRVTACNHHNVWNPDPVDFAFSLAPYFWQTKAFYGLSGATILAIAAGIQAYRLRWQHRLLKLEQQRALANERARIARDLHDDLGTALTGLALELDVIGRDPKPEAPVVHRLGQTAQRTRELAERMREVVWSVNPRCDTVSSLASFLEQQISQFLRAGPLKVELDFPEDIPPLPIGGEARHQLALGVREALTNVVRHAQATRVLLSLAIDENWLVVQVKDNGRGLQSSSRNGDGLRNMRERLQSIGGTFDFKSEPGSGATIIFKVPLIRSKSGESI